MFDLSPSPYYNHGKQTDCELSMKKSILFLVMILLLTACHSTETAENTTAPETIPSTLATEATTLPTVQETVPLPLPVVELTEEEKGMLLKLGMAERGNTECTECIALVMRTVLNRVEAGRFGKSIRSVILAQDQFTPVSDGSYHKAEPNERCQEALDMVIYGWDESQGALYYEWCTGESWHSKNLNLLFQHCDVRFYN